MEELAGVSEDDNNLLTCTMILEQNENDCRSGDGRSLLMIGYWLTAVITDFYS